MFEVTIASRPYVPPLLRALATLVEGGSEDDDCALWLCWHSGGALCPGRVSPPMFITSLAVALTVKRLLPGPTGHPSSGRAFGAEGGSSRRGDCTVVVLAYRWCALPGERGRLVPDALHQRCDGAHGEETPPRPCRATPPPGTRYAH